MSRQKSLVKMYQEEQKRHALEQKKHRAMLAQLRKENDKATLKIVKAHGFNIADDLEKYLSEANETIEFLKHFDIQNLDELKWLFTRFEFEKGKYNHKWVVKFLDEIRQKEQK